LSNKTVRSLQLGNVWFEEKQGGLARVYYELYRHLPVVGVDFCGLVVGSTQIAERHHGNVRGFVEPDRPMLTRFRAARQAVRQALAQQQFDVVASHFALYTAPVLDLIRKTPLVVHFHGPWAAEAGVEGAASMRSRLQGAMESAVYKRASRFIVLSRAFEQELVKRYKVPADRVRIVPAGVDIDRFHCKISRAEARMRLGWSTDRPTVLAVRRLVHRMGLEDLIDATRDLVSKIPDLQVKIAGTGRLAAELQQRILSQGLENHVQLLGRVEDELLPLAYRAADISIVPTVALEGFGMITLESLASGTPVLVTPVGGLPEVVTALSSALVLDGTGPHAIIQGLGDALTGARSLPTAEQCRQYAATNFTWPVIAQRVREVYIEALA